MHFVTFLANTAKIISKVHLIILCETNITDGENSFYEIEGFNPVFLNREGKGVGIALYVRNTLQFKNIAVQMIIMINKFY